jgi:hypothetical protein
MSFSIINDVQDLKSNAQQVELNNTVNSKVRSTEGKRNEDIEIFSKIVYGKDTSKYGDKVDSLMDKVKRVSSAALNGDDKAKAEINSIVTVTLQQPLMQRLNVANVLGNATTVGYQDKLEYTYYQMQASDLARIQASSGAFTFPTVKKRTSTVDTQTASAGLVIDYRELASGATDGLAMASDQILTSITNQVVLAHITALRNGIKNATTLKNYAGGITKTNVDAVLKKARRFGNVSITGDFNAVEKLNGFTGFNINSANPNEVRFPEAIMEEVSKTGLLSSYGKSAVLEMPNAYDLTQLNTAGDFYKTYLPTSDLWFIPQGQLTPLQMVTRGGLTSMTANDINTKSEVTRWDVEFGNVVLPEYIPFVGYIYDSALDD